jgi:uncharacterized membrane protein
MDDEQPQEPTEKNLDQDLTLQVARLTQRVYRLESTLQARGISLEEPAAGTPAPLRDLAPGITHPEAAPARPQPPRPAASPEFLAQQSASPNRSLESRIGSQWFNRIGILAVLIGMAWFLKLAIDNHWIGPAGRVLIGIIAGAALIAWSERFRARGYSGFSYSLKAIGTGVLYLSLWAAYSLFHLVPAPVAFIAMVLITAVNGFMAWTQESQLLALYALVGGYLTPLLLSSGENHQVALFTYLFVLNMATVTLAVLRPWSRLLAVSFAGSLFYFALWSFSYYSVGQFASTAFFIAIYFLLFALAPRLVRTKKADETNIFALHVLPFANAALGFLGFYIMLDSPAGDGAQSLAAVLFAAFYFFLVRLPSHLTHDDQREAHCRLKAYDLLIAIAFLAIALLRGIHHYWWQVSYDGNPALIHDINIYMQFTYSACFMLFGTALLVIGIMRRVAFLRWQALVVLAITVAKVFLVDIDQLNEGYRVLSFLGLGALLLAISFVYQRDWLNLRRQTK